MTLMLVRATEACTMFRSKQDAFRSDLCRAITSYVHAHSGLIVAVFPFVQLPSDAVYDALIPARRVLGSVAVFKSPACCTACLQASSSPFRRLLRLFASIGSPLFALPARAANLAPGVRRAGLRR